MDCRLIMTVEAMKDRAAWLRMRSGGIGGSDAAVIAGLSPWKSPYELYLEKVGEAAAPDLSDNERVYWGTVLEETVAREFTKRTGKKLYRRGLMQNNEYPFLLASIDRLVTGEDAGLECKTAGAYSKAAWDGDAIPPAYYCQCQHYMLVTGAPYWYIAVLIGGQHYECRRIERDEEDVAALLQAEATFWHCVETKQPPALDGSDSCTAALRERFAGGDLEPLQLPDDAAALIGEYDALKAAEAEAKRNRQEVENRLCGLLGDHEAGLIGDRRITWKTHPGRVTLDGKKLKLDYPAIYAKYSRAGRPYRTFRA